VALLWAAIHTHKNVTDHREILHAKLRCFKKTFTCIGAAAVDACRATNVKFD